MSGLPLPEVLDQMVMQLGELVADLDVDESRQVLSLLVSAQSVLSVASDLSTPPS